MPATAEITQVNIYQITLRSGVGYRVLAATYEHADGFFVFYGDTAEVVSVVNAIELAYMTICPK